MTIDSKYLAFLRTKIAVLDKARIPLLQRTLSPKNNALTYCINNKRLYPREMGLVAEFGVYKGRTINKIAKAFPKETIYGFDSFTGLPDDGRSDWRMDFSINGVLPKVRHNVRLIKGYFEDTLHEFAKIHGGHCFSFVHIDCDIYSSTKTIFDLCEAMIRPGCIIVFDELLHYLEFADNEMLALYEFLQRTGYDFEWVGIRGKIMDVDRILFQPDSLPQGGFKYLRQQGYMQEAAIRIITR